MTLPVPLISTLATLVLRQKMFVARGSVTETVHYLLITVIALEPGTTELTVRFKMWMSVLFPRPSVLLELARIQQKPTPVIVLELVMEGLIARPMSTNAQLELIIAPTRFVITLWARLLAYQAIGLMLGCVRSPPIILDPPPSFTAAF